MDQQTASLSALCQALIAHDRCATVVLDADQRVIACNAAARLAFDLGARAVGDPFTGSGLARGAPAVVASMETLRAEGRARPVRVETPAGPVSIAPLHLEQRLAGFVVRRRDAANAATLADDLHATRAELEASAFAERNKDAFLAMLAHELRTPLAPILSAMQILRRQAADNPVVQRAREVVERQALHQARLLDDLLDLSRVTRGKIELRRRAVSVAAAVTEALEATRGLIHAKAQRVALELPEEPVFVDADPTRLTQIVTNLVSNAARYTHAGGRIGITCGRDGEQVVVVVRDNGIGIPPEMLTRIFDLFAQADRADVRARGGLGIGLALVRSLVEMHGGTVVARSGGRGTGSEFELRFPSVAAPRAEEPSTRAGAPAPSLRVLLVEDNADTRETLRRVLELDGHRIQEAADGLEGVSLALASRPEVAIVDIGLPGLDGYEVARRLRAALGHGLRLIALTAYGQAEDRRLSRDAGFDLHLVKPVTPEQLAAALASRPAGEAA